MNRLTRKTNGKDYYSYSKSLELTNEMLERDDEILEPKEYYKKEPYQIDCYSNEEQILIKLGKLEDIEEELGCPLEVIFEALKQGYIYVYDNHYNFDNYTKTKSKITFNNNTFYIGFARLTRRLADYQKTWWLKGERTNE